MVLANNRDQEQREEDRIMSADIAFDQLAIEVIESSIREGSKTSSPKARQAEIDFLLSSTNPWIQFLDLSDETVDRLVGAMGDETLSWLD